MDSQGTAGGQDGAGEVDAGIQRFGLGVASHGGNGDGVAVFVHEAGELGVREGQDGDQSASLDLVLRGLGGADEHVNFAVGQALLLLGAAVITGDDSDLAAHLGQQGTEAQVAVGQGVAAGHLDTLGLGLLQDALQALIGSGVEDPGTVIHGADGGEAGAVEVHFLGAIGGAQVSAVNQAIAVNQQVHGVGVLIGELSRSGKAVAAGDVGDDEVVIRLDAVGHLRVFTGNQVGGAAGTVTADDGDGGAAVGDGFFLFVCGSGGCVGGGVAGAGAGRAAGRQRQDHGQGHNQGE